MKATNAVLLCAVMCVGQLVSAAEVKVDVTKTHQVFHGFGTCLKSWGNRETGPVVSGQYDPDLQWRYAEDLGMKVVRIPISKWVYEHENPYGIEPSATAEGMRDPDAISYKDFRWAYNSGRARGRIQYPVDFAKAIVRLNPRVKVIGSVWSPPHWMKEPAESGPGKRFHWSKYGCSSCGGHLNPDYYEHYAHYLAEWIKGLKQVHGIDLYAISIQNELHFYEPYNSCVYTPQEFADVVAVVGKVFEEEDIPTRIMGPEDMTKFPARTMGYVRAAMANPKSAEALSVICSHGYADGVQTSLAADDALRLWQTIQEVCPGKEWWMTETGGGGGKWHDIEMVWQHGKRKGQKRTVKGALSGFATRLHNAIVHGNASLWTTWQYLDTSEGTRAGLINVSGGEAVFTKKYYVQKHFARWTPQGAHRVEAAADSEGLLAVAFHYQESGALSVVVQNHAEEARKVSLRLSGLDGVDSLQLYLTDADHDCSEMTDVSVSDGQAALALPARSIVTLTQSVGR